MAQPADPDEQLAEFAWRSTQTEGTGATMKLIVRTAFTLIGADGAGITMIRSGGRLGGVAETSETITRSDNLQHALREGPCVEAATEDHNVLSTDLAIDQRWPRWGPQAAELGLRSIMSATLHTAGNRRLGALNLYGYAIGQFTARDLDSARLFAAHATAALWNAVQLENLTTALDSRTRIGQATGILMHRYHLTADQAVNVLKRYSQDTNTKMTAVVDDIIERRDLPDHEDPATLSAPDRPQH